MSIMWYYETPGIKNQFILPAAAASSNINPSLPTDLSFISIIIHKHKPVLHRSYLFLHNRF